jgi:hypothetical protein
MSNKTQQACKFLSEMEMNSAIDWLVINDQTAIPEIGGKDDTGKFILFITFDDVSNAVVFFDECVDLITDW